MNKSEVKIRGNTYILQGTLIVPETIVKNLPAVIFYHGMISQRKPRYVKRAEKLAEQGIVALTFDFQGCGESKGDIKILTIANWLQDALLAFDFLAHKPFIDKQRIGIAGKSFGGYIGALVSAKRNVKSMVVQAPGFYKDEWITKPYMTIGSPKQKLKYRNSKQVFNNMAIDAIKKYTNPLLVVGSEHDDICPPHTVEGYYKLAGSKNKKLIWINDADHPLTKEKWNKKYTDLMVEWFKKTL